MNAVFIPTSNLYRAQTLIKYYNIHDEPTDQRVIFIGDDRGSISKEEYRAAINDPRFDLIYTSDMMAGVNHLFEDCPYYDQIVNDMYKVSIKMLVFIYAARVLGIKKSLMLDDDILFLKPLDSWFKHDYVVKEDGLSPMPKHQVKAFQYAYPHVNIEQFNNPEFRINSGSIIYTLNDNDDRLVNDVRTFFSSDDIYQVFVNRLNKTNTRRKGWGYDWMLEQYFYGIHMYSLGVEIPRFKSAVNIGLAYPKENKPLKPFVSVPNVMHFPQMEKQRMYDGYLPLIDQYIQKHNLRNV